MKLNVVATTHSSKKNIKKNIQHIKKKLYICHMKKLLQLLFGTFAIINLIKIIILLTALIFAVYMIIIIL